MKFLVFGYFDCKNAFMKRILCFLIFPLLVGCQHTVSYKLRESDKWTGPKISGVLCVQSISDHTVYSITNWHYEHFENKVWRTNFRGGYSHTNLTDDVTAMVAKHLTYSGLFSKVVSGNSKDADYFLSGALTDFQTHGQINSQAEDTQAVFAAFGLAGAIVGSAATSDMKSEIRASVKLAELKLTDKSGQPLWQNSISFNTNFMDYFEEADQMVVFHHTDDALKNAVKEMINELGNSSLTNQSVATVH